MPREAQLRGCLALQVTTLLARGCVGFHVGKEELSLGKCLFDGVGEREAFVLPTEGTPEVIQIQCPHHGACQLLAFQVLHLVGGGPERQGGFSG